MKGIKGQSLGRMPEALTMKGVFLNFSRRRFWIFFLIGHEIVKRTIFHFAIIFPVRKIRHAIITFCNDGLPGRQFQTMKVTKNLFSALCKLAFIGYYLFSLQSPTPSFFIILILFCYSLPFSIHLILDRPMATRREPSVKNLNKSDGLENLRFALPVKIPSLTIVYLRSRDMSGVINNLFFALFALLPSGRSLATKSLLITLPESPAVSPAQRPARRVIVSPARADFVSVQRPP